MYSKVIARGEEELEGISVALALDQGFYGQTPPSAMHLQLFGPTELWRG